MERTPVRCYGAWSWWRGWVFLHLPEFCDMKMDDRKMAAQSFFHVPVSNLLVVFRPGLPSLPIGMGVGLVADRNRGFSETGDQFCF
jgi:hypothetical protein